MTRRKDDEAMVREWFKNHVATYSEGEVGGVRVERIVWKEPGSRAYRVDYTCIGGTTLCVAGDIGEAVYNTGAESMEWWTRCDLDYFASKCYASEEGRGFKTWDVDLAEQRLRESVDEFRNDGCPIEDEDVESAVSAIRDGRSEWEYWMREHAHRVFGDDWWDFAPRFGVTIALRCVGHLVGLKMAMAAIKQARAEALTAEVSTHV